MKWGIGQVTKKKSLIYSFILEIWAVQIQENRLWNWSRGKWHRRYSCLHFETNLIFFCSAIYYFRHNPGYIIFLTHMRACVSACTHTYRRLLTCRLLMCHRLFKPRRLSNIVAFCIPSPSHESSPSCVLLPFKHCCLPYTATFRISSPSHVSSPFAYHWLLMYRRLSDTVTFRISSPSHISSPFAYCCFLMYRHLLRYWLLLWQSVGESFSPSSAVYMYDRLVCSKGYFVNSSTLL